MKQVSRLFYLLSAICIWSLQKVISEKKDSLLLRGLENYCAELADKLTGLLVVQVSLAIDPLASRNYGRSPWFSGSRGQSKI